MKTMKNKLIKSALAVGALLIPTYFVNQATEIASKYMALKQFDNTEVSFKMYQVASNLGYVNAFFYIAIAASLAYIWKSKKIEK